MQHMQQGTRMVVEATHGIVPPPAPPTSPKSPTSMLQDALPPPPFRSGDDQLDAMLDAISAAIDKRRESVSVLTRTVEAFENLPKLFDREDVEKTRSQLMSASAELQALQTTYTQSQTLYEQNVMELETLIREKEEALLGIDGAYGTISSNDVLRMHFGSKQAELKKGVQTVKAHLCSMIQDMFARVEGTADRSADAGTGAVRHL